MEHFSALSSHVHTELSKVIVGQREVIDQLLLVLVCGGHAVIEGVPGLAKTVAVKSLARICGLGFQRVQCTADLMPADITGTSVFNLRESAFELHRGPVFTDLLLVDEINRTPPRTQAALLEAMEERQVTIEGDSYPLTEPFMVLATQNPVEYEGTYPLPEAQLDRFLFKTLVDYPVPGAEVEVLQRYHAGFDAHHLDQAGLTPVLGQSDLQSLRGEIQAITVEDGIINYIAAISNATRRAADLALGGSPRASIAMLLAAKAWAAMQGRAYVVPDDVKTLVLPIFRHRIVLKPEAEIEGLNADNVMKRVLATVQVPR